MVKEQIYIEGTAIDMGASSVQLSLQSNLMGKVSDLTANYSYTITLPRTLTNDRLLQQAWDITGTSGKLYTYLPCTYELGGLTLFAGKLVVTAVTESGYETNLVWGYDGLQTMQEEGKKLWELTGHYADWLYVYSIPSFNTRTHFYGNAAFGMCDYTSGMGQLDATEQGLPRVLPCVSARYVLNLISEQYGITLNMPQYASEIVDKCIIALTSKYAYRGDDYPTTQWDFATDKDPDTQVWSYTLTPFDTGQGILFYHNNGSIDTWTPMVDCTIKNMHLHAVCGQQFYVSLPAFGTITATSRDAQGRWYIDYVADGVEVAANTNMVWQAGVTDDTPTHGWIASLEMSYGFQCVPKKNEMVTGSGYPIKPNLPDMTCMEFIGELCAITGLVPIGMQGNAINCVNWATLMAAPVKLDVIGIEKLQTRAGSLAQRNVLAFATSDVQTDNGAGALLVNDNSLAGSADWFASSFAKLGSLVNIPLYTLGRENGELQVTQNKPKECISVLRDYETPATLASIDFSDIVSEHYTTMQAAISKPKVLQLKARITPAQLKSINYANAVYVEQLASYCGILEIENADADIYDVKVIKL